MASHRIAVIGGDGIGPEVIGAACEVLTELLSVFPELKLEFTNFDWGSAFYLREGRMMPEDGLDQLRQFNAILFGSVGSPEVPDHITLWGLRLRICQSFEQYANIRPARLLQGIKGPLNDASPEDLDWIIVRENTEGEYSGAGGWVHHRLPQEVGVDVSVFTRSGIERIMRFAFKLASSRPKKNSRW